MEDTDNGILCCANVFLLEQTVLNDSSISNSQRQRSVFSSDAVEPVKSLEFLVSIEVLEDDEVFRPLSSYPFSLNFCPGQPQMLSLVSIGDERCLFNDRVSTIYTVYGKECPELVIGSFDKSRFKTAPDAGVIWKSVLKSQLIKLQSASLPSSQSSQRQSRRHSAPEMCLVTSNKYSCADSKGEFTFRNLKVELFSRNNNGNDSDEEIPSPFIPSDGIEITDTVYLITGKSVDDDDFNDVDVNSCPKVELTILVKPNRVPTYLSIFSNGVELSESVPISVICGSMLSNITVQIYDQDRRLMEFDSEKLFDINSSKVTTKKNKPRPNLNGLSYNWASPAVIKKKFVYENKLEDLQVCNKVY